MLPGEPCLVIFTLFPVHVDDYLCIKFNIFVLFVLGNKVPVGGIIIKNTSPNMLPTNPIIHNSYQNNTQSVIGGLQQNTGRQSSIPTNSIVTSMNQTHPPPQLTNQNGIMTPSGDAAAVGNQNQAQTGDQQQDHQTEQQKSNETALANTKEKTPMCLINELARYNKVRQ